MSQQLDFLSDSEVRQINSLVDTLDRSNFDYLQLDIGDIKVTIGKGALPTGGTPAAIAPIAVVPAQPAPLPTAVASPAPAVSSPSTPPQAGWTPITATTMGRFYSKPDPSSPSFVKVGDRVTADATVCLIEVMKLFNAVPASINGTITQVCVEDESVVEFGQVLFYVQP